MRSVLDWLVLLHVAPKKFPAKRKVVTATLTLNVRETLSVATIIARIFVLKLLQLTTAAFGLCRSVMERREQVLAAQKSNPAKREEGIVTMTTNAPGI